jgi:hypothetical protein
VPPKPSLSQRRGRLPPKPPQQLKPLPPVPPSPAVTEWKPLPRPPERARLGTTLLWVLGFAVWFVAVVVMLPVVMEREVCVCARWGWRDGGG